MSRFRRWLIKVLAGKSSVGVNLTIKDGGIVATRGMFLCNVRIERVDVAFKVR